MAKQGEAAYAYFLKGYNCSQSVVAAFAPQLGLSEEMALRMSAGFGAGIGRMREVCGAFCGVVTVLSLVYADPADPQDKSRMYALVQEAARLYRARNGGDSIICRELLAKAGAAPSGGTKPALSIRRLNSAVRSLPLGMALAAFHASEARNSPSRLSTVQSVALWRHCASRNVLSSTCSTSLPMRNCNSTTKEDVVAWDGMGRILRLA